MFTIDNGIGDALVGTKMGILIMKNISASGSLNESDLSNSFDEMQRKYGNLDRKKLKELYPIQAYTAYYKKFGCSYPVLAQLESVLRGKKKLYAGSALLQAMFLSELESMLLTAGHDLSKLQLPLQLKAAAGNETYQSISGNEVTAVGSDLMVCDGIGVISSIMRGPDLKSCITSSTADVLFTVYAPPGVEADYIEGNLKRLEGRIRSFASFSKTELLQVYSKE
jgi:DNA/RNA-binding domain of Phe-tRNA-synthetase-like protein